MAKGSLKIECFSENTFIPVNKAKVIVTPTDSNGTATRDKVELYTNSSWATQVIELEKSEIKTITIENPLLSPFLFNHLTNGVNA